MKIRDRSGRCGTTEGFFEALLEGQRVCLKTSAKLPEKLRYEQVVPVTLNLAAYRFWSKSRRGTVHLRLTGYITRNKILFVECDKYPGQLLKFRDPHLRNMVLVAYRNTHIGHEVRKAFGSAGSLHIDTRLAEAA